MIQGELIGVFSDYTVMTVLSGSLLLGLIGGLTGTWAVLRRESLLGDVISHATLPGIAFSFLLVGFRNPLYILFGAIISGWVAVLWYHDIVRKTKIKSDTALVIVLSTFFGFGMVLLTFIQHSSMPNHAGLESYLFGHAASLTSSDIVIMFVVALIVLIITLLLWKEFRLICFDPQFAQVSGIRVNVVNQILITLMVVAIIIGLQSVGVVLMSILLIAPAAAARQWTSRLSKMAALSATFGAISGVTGTILSVFYDTRATGPVIVLIAVAITGLSFLLAPERGLVAQYIRKQTSGKKLVLEQLLLNLFQICSQHEDCAHFHSVSILRTLPGFKKSSLKKLRDKGWVFINEQNEWRLTGEGLSKIKELSDGIN